MFVQYRMDCLFQYLNRWSRFIFAELTDEIAAQVRGHQNQRIAKVDLTSFAVIDDSFIEYLIEEIQHIRIGFFDFVE
ncbi:hypothetical protein D3C76_1510180 [compost metagenome]